MGPNQISQFHFFNVDKQIACHHCRKQPMSKAWTCPCGENWFICNTHKWYAKNGNSTISPDDTNSRPTKSTKIDHHPAMEQNMQLGSDKNPRPNKVQKRNALMLEYPFKVNVTPTLWPPIKSFWSMSSNVKRTKLQILEK